MKVLVTGAAGFIGMHLCIKLAKEGMTVVGLDNLNMHYPQEYKYARLKAMGISVKSASKWTSEVESSTIKNLSFIRMDLRNPPGELKVLMDKGFDAVVNLAAMAGVRQSVTNPKQYIDNNVGGFQDLLDVCAKARIPKLVYASSSSVYGNRVEESLNEYMRPDPVSTYASTKVMNEFQAEMYSRVHGLEAIGLRFFTVYGEYGRPDMLPMIVANAIKKGKKIQVFNNGHMLRDFTYIDDVVNGIVAVIKSPPRKSFEGNKGFTYHRVFNLGKGSPTGVMEFIWKIEENMGKHIEKEFVPMQEGDVKQTWCDISKFSGNYLYEPKVPVDVGVAKFVDWFMQT